MFLKRIVVMIAFISIYMLSTDIGERRQYDFDISTPGDLADIERLANEGDNFGIRIKFNICNINVKNIFFSFKLMIIK